jgi:hypothetical protein
MSSENGNTPSEGSSEAPVASEVSGDTTPTPEVTNAPASKFKLSNGEEVEESELLHRYQYVKAANERFQSAAAERKAAEAERAKIAEEKAQNEKMLADLKKDPWSTLSSLGLDPRQLSEDKLLELLEQDSLSPEQKRIRELEAKAKEFETKEQERQRLEEERQQNSKKQQEEEEFNQLKSQAEKKYEADFLKALESSRLPKNPASIRRVAEKMHQSILAGEEIPVEHAVRLVEHEFRSSLAELVSGLSEEDLEEFLGVETLKRVRKHDVSKLKNPTPAPKVEVKEGSKAKDQSPSKYVNPKEFIDSLKKKHGVI